MCLLLLLFSATASQNDAAEATFERDRVFISLADMHQFGAVRWGQSVPLLEIFGTTESP